MKRIELIIDFLFGCFVTVTSFEIARNLSGVQLTTESPFFLVLLYGLPVVLLLIHALSSLGIKKGLLLIFLAAAVGTFFEYLGLTHGTFFGGSYIYKPQLAFFSVPLIVTVFWAVFIYTGYCLTNALVYFLKLRKPTKKMKNWQELLPLVLLDGYFVVALDLFLDPVAVRLGEWSWPGGGDYFGIPLGNFLGWFFITILVSGLFRTVEYFFTKKTQRLPSTLIFLPVLGYGLLAVFLAATAWQFQLGNFIFIGLLLMLPQVLVCSWLYFRRNQHTSKSLPHHHQ